MNKSKENTLIYMHIYTHTHGHVNIYINTDTHIHINTLFVICYSSQIGLFGIMFESV